MAGCEGELEPFAAKSGPEGDEAVAAICELALRRAERQAALACSDRLRARNDLRGAEFARRAAALP